MRIKSYFANSMAEAMDKARAELGPEAMLISSRQTEQDLKELGSYEIVFGAEPGSGGGQALAAKARAQEGAASHSDAILKELAELRKQVENFRSSVARTGTNGTGGHLTPDLRRIFDRLTDAGFSDELAAELTESVGTHARPRTEQPHRMIRAHLDLFTRDLLDAVLSEEVGTRFETAPSLGKHGAEATAVLLVGPPGAGKTSMLMKLGLQYGLKFRQPLHLISLDTLRISAWEQLSAFARIAGATFEPLQHPSHLQSAVAARSGKDLVLIDTPGLSRADEHESEELAEAARHAHVEVQLVLPANLSLQTAQQTWKRFATFAPAKLILTRLDDCEVAGPAVEFAIRSGLPISFLSNGQQIPEDMYAANKQQLTEQLLPTVRTFSVAA